MIVYKYTNKINEKIYIGITKNLNKRIEQHMHAETPLGEDIRKYGISNFNIEILAVCSTISEAKALEKSLIEQLNCREPNGYNKSDGGEFPITPVSLKKLPKKIESKPKVTIGESLRRFRKDFGVTQQQVADAIQVLKPSYQRYEYGTNVPTATVLMKIADAYNVSIDYLVGRTDNPARV